MGLRDPKRIAGVKTKSHVRAPKQERELASRLGGKITPGSGSRDLKGDIRVTGVMRVECKNTLKKSFTLTREMVRKIEEAALGAGEVPAIQIDFIDQHGRLEHSVAVVPLFVLNRIVEADDERP